jgi:hypothetical protein
LENEWGNFPFLLVYSLSSLFGFENAGGSSPFYRLRRAFLSLLQHLIPAVKNELGKWVAVNIAATGADGDVSAVDALGGRGRVHRGRSCPELLDGSQWSWTDWLWALAVPIRSVGRTGLTCHAFDFGTEEDNWP